LNTYTSAKLYFLQKYGPVYLSSAELQAQSEHTLDRYYAFLSRSFFRRRGRVFWTFHKERLRELGHPLRYARLGCLIGNHLLDIALNPKRAVEAAWRFGGGFFRAEGVRKPDTLDPPPTRESPD